MNKDQEQRGATKITFKQDLARPSNVQVHRNSELYQFNPIEAPIYLGLFVQDQTEAKKQIKSYIEKGLEIFTKIFPKENIIQHELNLLERYFYYPANTHHITSYSLKNNRDHQNSHYYKKFQENLEADIIISAFVYVPDYLMCGVTFTDDKAIDIQAEFPYMILMKRHLEADYSYNTIQGLFNENGPLHQEYKNGKIKQQKYQCKRFSLKIDEESEKKDVYFIKFSKNLIIPSFTRGFYENPDYNWQYAIKQKEIRNIQNVYDKYFGPDVEIQKRKAIPKQEKEQNGQKKKNNYQQKKEKPYKKKNDQKEHFRGKESYEKTIYVKKHSNIKQDT